MKIRIVSDSSSDILELENIDYKSVPLKIITDEKEYIDDKDLNVDSMIEDLLNYKGTSRTSCPNADDWLKSFEGSESVFCVTITSNLSGSYNSARIATEDFLEEGEGKKASVLDSLSAGPENALIVEKLIEILAEGVDFEEADARIREYMKSTHLAFCLESLRNLANNGRIGHAAAKISGILGIRIVGKASNEGTLELTDKVRGADKAVKVVYDNMRKAGYNGGKVRIHHCNNSESADNLSKMIRADYPEASVVVHKTRALCSFYAEEGGFLVGYEGNNK